jgi:hypothetical protein
MKVITDKLEILKLIEEEGGESLEYASADLRANREVVLAAVNSDGRSLEYASDEFKSDREIVLEAVKSDGSALKYASEELKLDRSFIIEVEKSNKLNKKDIDFDEEKTIDLSNAIDEEVLNVLQQMSPDDKLIVVNDIDCDLGISDERNIATVKVACTACLNLFPQSKEWVLNELIDPTTNKVTNHIDFIKKTLKSQCKVFVNYSYINLLDGFNMFINAPNIDDDYNVEGYEMGEDLEMAIRYNEIKSIVKFGIYLFKSGPYFRLEISCFDVCALLLICKKLIEENKITVENPEDFIELILNELYNPAFSLLEDELNHPTLFKDVDYSYIADFISYYDVLNNELMINYYFLHDFDNHISLNSILNGGNYSYLFLNEEYKKLTYDGIHEDSLNQLDDCIINDIDFKNDLFKYNPKALSYRNEWSFDRELVFEAVKNNGSALEYASADLRADREIVFEAVKSDCSALEYASADLRADREVVLAAVKSNGGSLTHASEALQSDREIVLAAMKSDVIAIEYASEDLKSDRSFLQEAGLIK